MLTLNNGIVSSYEITSSESQRQKGLKIGGEDLGVGVRIAGVDESGALMTKPVLVKVGGHGWAILDIREIIYSMIT